MDLRRLGLENSLYAVRARIKTARKSGKFLRCSLCLLLSNFSPSRTLESFVFLTFLHFVFHSFLSFFYSRNALQRERVYIPDCRQFSKAEWCSIWTTLAEISNFGSCSSSNCFYPGFVWCDLKTG